MLTKVTKFRMLPSRRAAPDAMVPANDNRRGVLAAAMRARAPRLICRWELGDGTNRPTCRWELDSSDEPNPAGQCAPLIEQGFHETVLQLSYPRKSLGAAARTADVAPYMGARTRRMAKALAASCCVARTSLDDAI